MKFLLDTNVCIDAMRGDFGVREKLMSLSPDDCSVSAITLFELETGARKSRNHERELGKIRTLTNVLNLVSFDAAAAAEAANIRAVLESNGSPIGGFDTLLAGHAKALDFTFVTDNTKEFSRVPGLRIENWRT
ncbi:MAG: tRNA(fMet)-specific endonuclease VapC [Verrucomicrobiales bacterium]|jgi:tRNA(fMet)-specific endonuclease VapC